MSFLTKAGLAAGILILLLLGAIFRDSDNTRLGATSELARQVDTDQVQEWDAERVSLQTRVSDLEAELLSIEQQKNALDGEIAELRVRAVETDNSGLQSELDAERAQREAAAVALADVSMQLNNLRDQQQVSTPMALMGPDHDKVVELETRLRGARTEVDVLMAKQSTLRDQLQASAAEKTNNAELQVELQARDSKLVELDAKITGLASELEQTKIERDSLAAKVAELSDAVESSDKERSYLLDLLKTEKEKTAGLDQQMVNLRDELRTAQIATAKAPVDPDLSERVVQLQTRLDGARTEITLLADKRAGLEKKIADLQGSESQLAEQLNGEIATLQTERDEHLATIAELNGDIKSVQGELALATDGSAEQAAGFSADLKLAQKNATVEREYLIGLLRNEKSTRQSAASDLALLAAELNELKLARDKLKKELMSLRVASNSGPEINALKTKIAGARTEINLLTDKRTRLETQLKDANAKTNSAAVALQERINSLETQLQQSREKHSDYDAEITGLQAERQELATQTGLLQKQLDAANSKANKENSEERKYLMDQLAAQKKRADEFSQQMAGLLKERDALAQGEVRSTKKIADLEAMLSQFRQEVEDLTASQMVDENEELVAQLNRIKNESLSRAARVQALGSEVDTLKRQLAETESASVAVEQKLTQETARMAALLAEKDAASLADREAIAADLATAKAQLETERDYLFKRLQQMKLELDAVGTMNKKAAVDQQELTALLGKTQRELDIAKQVPVPVAVSVPVNTDDIEAELLQRRLQDRLTTAQLEAEVNIRPDHAVSVRVPNRAFFKAGSTSISPVGQAMLGQVASVVAPMSNHRVQVEGHTDNIPIGASLARRYDSNWELSMARAVSAVKFLEERTNFEAVRLSGAGYGENQPVASNANADGRRQNRRIEIVVYPVN